MGTAKSEAEACVGFKKQALGEPVDLADTDPEDAGRMASK